MIQHPAFPIEPWVVRETHLDLDRLPQLAIGVRLV